MCKCVYNYVYYGVIKMSKRVNLYIQDEVLWEHFTLLVGRGNVSKWIENYIRPFVDKSDLASSYKMMANDTRVEPLLVPLRDGLMICRKK